MVKGISVKAYQCFEPNRFVSILVLGRHLLLVKIRAHFWQIDGGYPRVQEPQENGHNWSLR